MSVPTWAAGAVASTLDDGAGGRLAASALGFLAVLTLVVALPALLVGAAVVDTGGGTSLGDGTGLPAGARPFLAVYEDAARVYGVSPFLLMATHEDETAFSTSTAPGVRDGVNSAGCCAGAMQFSITAGATPGQGGRGGTWAGYAHAADRARLARPAAYPGRFTAPAFARANVYDSYDAIYAAAAYFHALGAGPGLDERTYRALLSYKGTPPASIPFARHDYERARELERLAAGTAGTAGLVAPAFGADMVRVAPAGAWLAAVPGAPGGRCDRRILPNLVYLIRRYRLAVTDCHSTDAVHAAGGEHPLGLGVDLVPGPGGSWELVDELAAAAEPAQDQPRPPFRWVGYDGDPNHGRGNHLHLSWQHAPAAFNTPAPWVLVAR
jgi:hypothetical protein